ncbi:MAG: flagellar protein FlaG [Mariprofundus sp.]|nr:flagellar protein FlaG [Mariprofundus sp.]
MTAISTIIQSSPVFASSAPVSAASVATVIAPKAAPSMAPAVAQPNMVQQNMAQQGTAQQPSLRDVQQAVKQANMSLPSSNESITFGYEEKLGQLIVQVSDKATGRVIQQLPSKEFIQYQIYMKEMIGLLLDKQA